MAAIPEITVSSRQRLGLWDNFKRVWGRRETIRYLYQSNLKAGHRDKVLGTIWSLLDPLLFIGVYYLVFGVIFQQRMKGQPGNFLMFLVIGVVCWRFVEATISQATLSVKSHRGLIHAISFPKAVVPISIGLSRLYDFLWGLGAFGILMLLSHVQWSWPMLLVPVLIVLQLFFVWGCALIVSYLGAFYADTSNIVVALMRLWFYLSPIFYYATTQPDGARGMIPDRYAFYYQLNPLAALFQSYRSVILYQTMPETWMLVYVALVSVATMIFGFAVFTRGEGEFSKYV